MRRKDVYEPMNEYLDVIQNTLDIKTKEQLSIVMRQMGFHKKKDIHKQTHFVKPSELQLDYAWRYLKEKQTVYIPMEYEKIELFKKRKKRVVRDKRTGRFRKWID